MKDPFIFPIMPTPTPSRLRLSDALVHLEPLMSKSKFYGTRAEPGPRYTHVDRLDIREGPPLTVDRRKFFRWLAELTGAPASADRTAFGSRTGRNDVGHRHCAHR